MKHSSLSCFFLTYLVLGFALQAVSQTVPAGCAQARGPILPWQDCAGALWITKAETIIQTLNVKGPGCTANELPASTETCLITNERRTVWLMFEVQPLATGATYRGAPAGQLRFSIIPGDVDHQSLADDGTSMLGLTDYDFALFKVTDQASQADACASIAAAKHVGAAGTPQVACNYAGLAGPTGLQGLGNGLSVDDNRYCKPISVSVGDVFLLAVDNYSLNATYFRLLFSQDPASTTPSAQIAPADQATFNAGATLAMNKACGYGLELDYPAAISLDSITTAAFTLTYKGKEVQPASIQVLDADMLRRQGSKLLLMFNQKMDTGMLQLEQKALLANKYGQSQTTFTRLKALRAPVSLALSSASICAGQGMKVLSTALPGFAYGGWNASAGLGTGVGVLGGYHLLNGEPTPPGQYAITYRFFWPEGCLDSVSTFVTVRATPPAPTLSALPGGLLEAELVPQADAQWQTGYRLFAAPALFTPSSVGSYRVRQILTGCTSSWSPFLAANLTPIQKATKPTVGVFPNPASDWVSVSLPQASASLLQISLINEEGKTVIKQNQPTGTLSFRLTVSSLPAGIYSLLIIAGAEQSQHRLVIE